LAVGPVVGEISRGFDGYWNSERSFPVAAIVSDRPDAHEVRARRDRLREDLQAQPDLAYALPSGEDAGRSLLEHWRSDMIWAEASVVSDQVQGLDDTDSAKPKRVAQTIVELAAGVERELLIESAYLILGDQGLALTRRLTDRGVAVRALTNSLASNDVTPNHAGYVPLPLDARLRAGSGEPEDLEGAKGPEALPTAEALGYWPLAISLGNLAHSNLIHVLRMRRVQRGQARTISRGCSIENVVSGIGRELS